jgi:hypothetical protein
MSFLKATGIFLLILFCLGIIGFAFAVPSLERKAREEIVDQLQTKLDAKVELKAVKLSSLWPLGLRFQDFKIIPQNGQYRVDIGQLYVRYHYLSSLVEIDLEKPNIDWVGAPTQADEKQKKPSDTVVTINSNPPGAVGAFVAGLGAEIFVREGIVRWQKDENTQVSLRKLNVDISKKRVLNLEEPIKAIVDSELHYSTPFIGGQTTISARTESLKADTTKVSAQELDIAIGGLLLRANGNSDLVAMSHDWKVRADVEDLQKLPRPPDFLPAQNWKGKIGFDASLHMDKANLAAQGTMKLEKVSMDLRWDSPELKAQGPANLDFHTTFDVSSTKTGLQYNVKDLGLWAELTKASFQYSNLFKKPADVPLNIDFKGSLASNAVDIQSLAFKLFNLSAQAKGTVPFKGKGKIDFQTTPTSLVGWEKLILPMAQMPLQGTLEVRGGVTGAFDTPKEMAIEVSKISLHDFKGQVKYKSEDQTLSVEGPVSANVDGRLSLQGESVKGADVTAKADLSAVAMRKAGVFEKKPGEVFRVSFVAKQQKEDIGIEKSEILLPFMTMNVGGRIHNPKDPSFDLNVHGQVASVETLKGFMPSMKDVPLNGSLNAQMALNGRYASDKPWNNWPMRISGQVKWTTPKYQMPASAPASAGKNDKGKGESAPGAAPGPFLPKGFLTENLNVGLEANIGKFIKDKLVMENTSVKGRIAKGSYTGTLSSHGFGGLVQLNNSVVPLFETDPTVESDIHFSDIKIESILEFLKPEFKDAAKGPSKGDLHVSSVMPGSPTFMSKLKAKGSVGSDNIWINTTSLNEMINEQISKIPGVGKNSVKLDPLQGRLQSSFNLADEKADPLSIDGYDRSGTELHLHGSANLEKTVDLTGEFKWANAPLTGCIKEGNSDEKGRVVVPLALKGPVTSPSWSFATDVLAKMGEKALRCEAVKALQKQLPINLPNGVGDEIGKKLKDLLGH